MNWQPKYLEIRLKAEEVAKKYRSGLTPQEIADSTGTPLGSIYRYLRYTGDIKGRKKDPITGRFIASNE
jgi:DNA invertase Pin-like site-specific DNA recombinase